MTTSVSATGTWFVDKPRPAPVDLRGQRVTAILVARNGAEWLTDTLTALSRLTLRPAHIIAVDNGSTDRSPEILEAARRAGIVDTLLRGHASASFGEAVAQATAEFRPGNHWIWLLHDDGAPDPNALTHLLTLALRTPNLAVAVPLQVRPTRRRHTPLTLELGSTIAGTGRRHLNLEPGEAAQGQYDPAPVLGGSTCGMLVSQSAFEALHGFSSTIPSYRDGVDLGWRANLAGYAVMTCPDAQFTHHQAGRSERREGTLAQARRRSEIAWDRLMGMRLVAAHSSGAGALVTWLKLVGTTLVRALGYLLDKAPDQSRDELHALGDFVRSAGVVQRLRRRIGRLPTTDATRHAAAALRPPWYSALVSFGHTLADLFRSLIGSRRGEDLMLDDLLGDQYESRAGDKVGRLPRWIWGLGLVVLAVVSIRGLFATGSVRAEHLLGAPATLTEAFHMALASPAGTDRPAAPWLLMEAIGSVPFIRPNWFVVGVLVLAVPLTTLIAAWYLRRHLGQHRRMSWVVAIVYGLLPALLGGLNRGDLWLVVLAALLPFFVAWLSRWGDVPHGVRAWQPAAGVAVALTLAIPLVPALWLPAAIAVGVTAVRSCLGGANWFRALVAVTVPVVLWGDWLVSLKASPGRLLTAPSPLLGSTTTTPAWQMLIGRIQAGGLPPLWVSLAVFGVIWLGAIIAIIRLPRLLLGGVAALAFLTAGIALSRFTVAIDTSRSMPNAGPWILIGFAALLSVIVTWLDAGSTLKTRDFGLAQALIGVLSAFLTVAMGVAIVWWTAAGVSEVWRGDDPRVPYFVAQGEVSYGANSLIIDQSGETTRWTIRSNGRPTWDQGETRTGVLASSEAWAMAQQAVAQIEAGRYDETLTEQLSEMGVRYVVLVSPRGETAGALEASTGLGRGSSAEGSDTVVYQVLSAPTAIQVLTPGGTVSSLAPADGPVCAAAAEEGEGPCWVETPSSRALLLISQPPDAGLVVSVGGVQLAPAESPDWRAAYSLEGAVLCQDRLNTQPAGCGLVTVSYVVADPSWRYVQLVLGFLMILFALPSATAGAVGDRSPRHARAED
jgi:GT2 family glycosyltransferase